MGFGTLGIRGKLILIFVLIKVLPLIALAWFAWDQVAGLGQTVTERTAELSSQTQMMVGEIGSLATRDSIKALDDKSRETIERLTTDTARQVAAFLHDRDEDILQAANLPVSKQAYTNFLAPMTRTVIDHKPWALDPETDTWAPADPPDALKNTIVARNVDNAKDFHSRPPEQDGILRDLPLYHEMTFVDLEGNERLKVSTTNLLDSRLHNISKRDNTYCRAESYFPALKNLRPGEIYVSEVIGPYVRGRLIGPYTKARAQQAGIEFDPENSGYAGKENPVGKRFQGIVRWAAPVFREGVKQGYVTLALDHTHIMEFTDHVMPTEKRYSPISDAASGNYAFIWDYKGRNISHPRDYFIHGYDPETGLPAVPWMDTELYEQFKQSGLNMEQFQSIAPTFHDQSLQKKPAEELTRQGLVALDGRYLNFAPQCTGWHNLTAKGGSGSFVIFWSGLWKLTTAAAIPYHTGIYGKHPRGFGYVTIGANVHEFHRAATETAAKIDSMVAGYEQELKRQDEETRRSLAATLRGTARNLGLSTTVMIILVILIAIWMASTLTSKITSMITGVRRFQQGDMNARLDVGTADEMGQLSLAFNEMSDSVQQAFQELTQAESRYRNIIEHAAAGIFQSSLEGRFLNVNPALAKMMGYDDPQEMIDTLTDLASQFYVDPTARKGFLEHLEQDDMVHELEFQAYRKDGTAGAYSVNARLVHDQGGPQPYIEGMVLDITDRKDKERAERERKMADAANLAKSEFLARMSHEIRTPMNAVIGVADLLEEYDLDNEQEMLVKMLKSSGDNLLSLIDDILDLSKIEAGKLIIEESVFELREEIAVLCSLLANRAYEKALEFDYDLDPDVPLLVRGDQARLRQVLTNLLGNAVKFTHTGEIRLNIYVLEAAADQVELVFEVRDTGIGIPPDKLATVFESFGQVDSSITRSYGGTGLGLAICKRLVELMGGTIGVESTLGRGSTFSFTLSFGIATEQVPPLPSLNLAGISCLVADDHDLGRVRISRVLSDLGAEVTETTTGRETLDTVRDMCREGAAFDLIFLDSHLGDLDGFSVAETLIAEEDCAGRIFLLATAMNLLKNTQQLNEMNLAGYLIKPVNQSVMISTLRSILAPHAAEVREMDAPRKRPGPKKRILVVDDAEDNRLILEQYLKNTEYEHVMAEDGQKALQLLQEQEFKIVLMDMQMPVMDGYTAVARLRSMEEESGSAHVPVVALTAHAMADDREKCLNAGCDDYLSKPVRKASLLTILRKYLES